MRKYIGFTQTATVLFCVLLLAFTYIPSTFAADTQFIMQDGYGYSGIAPTDSSPLADSIDITGFSGFPAGINAADSAKFSGGAYDGNGNIWLVPVNTNQVVKINTSTGDMTSYSSWPAGFNSLGSYKFRSGVYDGLGGLWLIPSNANQVIKLETATGVMTAYSGWPAGFDADKTSKFYGGIFHDGSIWLVPSNADRVVKLDTATGSMTGYNGWPSGFNTSSVKFIGGIKDNNGFLWMIPCNANMLVKINLADGSMTGYNSFPLDISATGTEKFSGGVSDSQGNLWMIPNNAGAIVKVNTATGGMVGYGNWPSGISASSSNKFSGGTFDGKNIWMAPQKAAAVVKFDPQTGIMTEYHSWPSGFNAGATIKFAGSVYDGYNVWLIPYLANRVIKLSGSFEMGLSASVSSSKVYLPDTATISAHITNDKNGSTISKVEYFRLKTTDSSTITTANYSNHYLNASAADKGVVSTPTAVVSSNRNATYHIPVNQNATYWVRVTIEDSIGVYTKVDKLTVRNIYTPCLYVKGVDTSGNVLYNEPYPSGGIPLEIDGSLLLGPPLGYDTVTVSSKNVDSYRLSASDSYTITLDSTSYLNTPDGICVFTYTDAGTNPIVTPGGPKQPETPSPEIPVIPNVVPPITQTPAPTPDPTPPPTQKPVPTPTPNPTPEYKKAETTDNDSNDGQDNEVPTYGGDAPNLSDTALTSGTVSSLTLEEKATTSTPIQESIIEKESDNTIVCTLTAIANKSDDTAYRFMIIDRPSGNLKLLSGSIPAFTKGEGLTYSVLYKTNQSNTYKVIASGVPANSPYTITPLVLTPDETVTEITVFFDEVPAGFAADNVIQYTFLALNQNYGNNYLTYWNSKYHDRETGLAALNNTMNDCLSNYSESDYSKDSWERLKSAIQNAQDILNDPYSTDAQIAAANQAIAAAKDELESLSPEQNSSLTKIILLAVFFVFGIFIFLLLLWFKKRNRGKPEYGTDTEAEDKTSVSVDI